MSPTRRSHPLYIIPNDYARDTEVLRLLFQDQSIVTDRMANGDLHIYATSLPGLTYFDHSDEWNEAGEVCLEDFSYKHVATPEEVMRALQGPPGPQGPQGATGPRGESRKCECLEVEDELAAVDIDLSEGGGRAKGSER